MKTSNTWNSRSILGKVMMGLVFAAIIGNVDAVPALGKDHGNDGQKGHGYYDDGRYENRGRGHAYGHDKGRYEHRGYGYDHYGRPQYYPYGYRERVYVSPPVIYAPPPPPGISIFFPPIIIHP